MRLTDEQAYYLTILGHDLRPVVDVGAGGVTNHDLRRIEQALEDQELVKVRVPFGSRERRAETLKQLAPMADAHLVRRSSNSALLYRPAQEPSIALPADGAGAREQRTSRARMPARAIR